MWPPRAGFYEARRLLIETVERDTGLLRLGQHGVPAVKLAVQGIPTLVDLLLVGRAQVAIEMTQGVELAVLAQRQLPPRRRLDGLDLGVPPGQGVGRPWIQSAADRVHQRLVERHLRPADIAGQDVLAGNRRQWDGGEQPSHYDHEHQAPQTPHHRTSFVRQRAGRRPS